MLKRYEEAKSWVYEQFGKIYNTAVQEQAFCHTNSVDNMATLLAIGRGENMELVRIAALFHDFAVYYANCPHRDHARLSSLYAHKYLMGTKKFTTDEVDEICHIIACHSNKDVEDEPICEILKDADVMARFLEDPYQTFPQAKQKRLLKGFEDIKG